MFETVKTYRFAFILILLIAGAFYIKTSGNNEVLVESDEVESDQLGMIEVKVDDDAFLGEDNAPIVLIEFSSFECRFCRKSYFELLPQIKQFYIDTGKVKFVYRDFPLPSHSLARQKAQAAECARDQGGDEVYFKFHNLIFENTDDNGKGLEMDEVFGFTDDLDLDRVQFEECMSSEKYADEVEYDVGDGVNAGATSTPTWYIGRNSQDGEIQAQKIVGAVPYAVFQSVIGELLIQQ